MTSKPILNCRLFSSTFLDTPTLYYIAIHLSLVCFLCSDWFVDNAWPRPIPTTQLCITKNQCNMYELEWTSLLGIMAYLRRITMVLKCRQFVVSQEDRMHSVFKSPLLIAVDERERQVFVQLNGNHRTGTISSKIYTYWY